jgi:hypothetical protein
VGGGARGWDMLLVEEEWGEAEVGNKVEKFENGSIDWSSAKGVRH